MGINFRKRILLQERILKRCTHCKKIIYQLDDNFCSDCGDKLISEKTKIYANYGKSGITSISYKMPDGTTINSKGSITTPITNGVSYTQKM